MNYGCVELFLDQKAGLAEGISWDWKCNKLYWVDIPIGTVYVSDPQSAEVFNLEVDKYATTVVPTGDGRAVVSGKKSLYLVDIGYKKKEKILDIPFISGTQRLNDGKCDQEGRVWIGTFSLTGEQAACVLYRISPHGECKKMLDGVGISNGITWSADGRTMYYIDTPLKKVWAFDFSPDEGIIYNKRVSVDMKDIPGFPDGMTIDEQGMLWVAMWDGWSVCRFNPFDGRLIGRIELPVSNVTSCAFGGKNLDELYITTSRGYVDKQDLEKQLLAGGLFMAKTDICGIRCPLFNCDNDTK